MRTWMVVVSVTVAIAALTQMPALDVRISDAAYDFGTGMWLIDHTHSAWRPFLYDGPKALVILLGTLLIGNVIWPSALSRMFFGRREAVFLLLCLAIVPALVGTLKRSSGVTCAYSIQRYGGDQADRISHVSIAGFLDESRSEGCWSSGHASAGFMLLAFAWLGRTRKMRAVIATAGLSVGALMGGYQVLRGAHFASHIAITLCIALVLISIIAAVFPPHRR